MNKISPNEYSNILIYCKTNFNQTLSKINKSNGYLIEIVNHNYKYEQLYNF